MTKSLIKTTALALENNQELKLLYYITTKYVNQAPVFGVSVEKYLYNNIGDYDFVEVETESNLTYFKDTATAIINGLSKNTVTPMGLICVLDEMMTEYIE